MDKRELDKLKALLRRRGFDDRIDFKLTEYIRLGQATFYIPYRIDFGKDFLVCELVFAKNDATNNYRFNGYSASLYKRIQIPQISVHGIDVGRLQRQLDRLSKPGPVRLGAAHDNTLITIENSMETLRQTNDGRKLAELLMTRYRPSSTGLRLEYDAISDRYMLGRVVSEEEGNTLRSCLRLLIDEMNSHIPDFAALETFSVQLPLTREFMIAAIAIDLKSGAKLAIKSSRSFTELKEALPLLTELDHRLFDKDFVRLHAGELKWYLKEISLVDAVTSTPVMTVRSQATDKASAAKVRMTMELQHPELGWITFSEQWHGQPTGQVPGNEIKDMQRMLIKLGLVKTAKTVSVKVLPPPRKGPVAKRRRRGGGQNPS